MESLKVVLFTIMHSLHLYTNLQLTIRTARVPNMQYTEPPLQGWETSELEAQMVKIVQPNLHLSRDVVTSAVDNRNLFGGLKRALLSMLRGMHHALCVAYRSRA